MDAKECSNYHTLALISHVSKIMLKILQAMLQQYMNQEFQMWKLGLEKAEVPGQIQYLLDHSKSKGIKKKNLLLLHWLRLSLWLCGSQQLLKILKEVGIPKKAVCRTRSNSYYCTWNNGLVQNWERSTSRLYIVTLLLKLICGVHQVKCRAGWLKCCNQDCQEKY